MKPRLRRSALALVRGDLVADELDLLGDRHVDAVCPGEVADRQAAVDALRGLPGREPRLFEGLAATETLTEGAVARQR